MARCRYVADLKFPMKPGKSAPGGTPSTPLAKLTRPRLAATFSRTRLFRRLDEALGHPAVWIVGLPGAGKTSLASSYAEQRGRQAWWYQLDGGDGDVATFFHYLRKWVPDLPQTLPAFSPDRMPALEVFARRYFEALYPRLPPGALLIFDNYHELPGDSPIHEVFREAIGHLPPGINALFLSREPPPPAFARLRLNSHLAVLEPEALLLDADEAAGLALSHGHGGLEEETIDRLNRHTHGWAAGLVLLLSQPAEDRKTHEMGNGAPQVLFDYFTEEIFRRAAPAHRDVLLHTVCLPSFTAEAARMLSGNEEAEDVLSHLANSNFFTVRQGNETGVYQYHPLFRDFLLRQAQTHLGVEGLQALQRRAAGLLEQDGRAEEAVELLRDAGAWEDMARLVETRAAPMLRQGRLQTLMDWIRALPLEILRISPRLLYWFGICHFGFAPTQARDLCEQALELFDSRRDSAGTLLAWCGIADSYYFEGGDHEPLDRWIGWFNARPDPLGNIPPDVQRRVIVSFTIALIYRQPHHPDIRMWSDRLLQILQHDPDANLCLQGGSTLAHYYLWMGETGKVAMVVEALTRWSDLPQVMPTILVAAKFHEGLYRAFTGYHRESFLRIAEGLALADTHQVHYMDSLLLGTGAEVALATHDPGKAESYLERMREIPHRRRVDSGFFHYVAGWHCLVTGEPHKAWEHAQAALSLAEKLAMPFFRALALNAALQAAYHAGERQRAAVCLAELQDIAHGTGSAHFEFLSLFAQTLWAMDEGDSTGGVALLQKVLGLGRRHDLMLMPWWTPEDLTRLFVVALEKGIEGEYVRKLIRTWGLAPPTPPIECEAWPWPITIRTLGGLKVSRYGEPLVFRGKTQKKPMDLLKALISHGGVGVDSTLLTAALWPGNTEEMGESSFRSNVHRLRKLLGSDDTVSIEDGKLSLDARCCWVDLWAFERLVRTVSTEGAPDLSPSPEDTGLRSALDQLLRLYHGPFLGQEEANAWTLPTRERLSSLFRRCAVSLGEAWEKRNRWDQAEAAYRRVLEADPLAEEIYRRLMICHGKRGEHAEALNVYRRCREMLSIVLGVPPSNETERVHRTLLHSLGPKTSNGTDVPTAP